MDKSSMTLSTQFQIENICIFVIPFLIQHFTIISIQWYKIVFALSLFVAIVLYLLFKRSIIKNQRPHIMGFSLAISIFFSIIVSTNMTRKENSLQYTFKVNTTFREKYEKAAENGSVENMVKLGQYYSSYYMQTILSAPTKEIRDDELVDHRDFQKAIKYLKMAAYEHDSPDAYAFLGKMAYEGLGSVPSRKEAIIYFSHAYDLDKDNPYLSGFLRTYNISREELIHENN